MDKPEYVGYVVQIRWESQRTFEPYPWSVWQTLYSSMEEATKDIEAFCKSEEEKVRDERDYDSEVLFDVYDPKEPEVSLRFELTSDDVDSEVIAEFQITPLLAYNPNRSW